jgi:hypothetical protein
MEDFQAQMNAVLQNPDMMQKIINMAQSLGGSPAPPAQENTDQPLPDIDFAMVQKLSGLIGQSNIDSKQRCLLDALQPYLSSNRIIKLEKAMRAAKLATMASTILSTTGISLGLGR